MNVASRHLSRLGASSRPAGSEAAAEARDYCANVLRELGFTISEHTFEYSAFVGKWATPIAGVLVPPLAVTLALVRGASAVWTIGLVLMVAVAGVALRYLGRNGVLDFPFLRRRGVNLQAVRGTVAPRVWLVAHIDSKWQPIAMMTRVAGVIAATLALVVLLGLSLSRYTPGGGLTWAMIAVATFGSVPLMLSYVGDRNHGTLDNASGVAAVLEAAAIIPPTASVGILITDAEELGLAGARAWARSRLPALAINCDSIDDEGRLVAMYSRPAPAKVLSRLVAAASEGGDELRPMRLIPGILTDHVALAAGGWQTVTLSRGSARTLGRIHTSRDTLASMKGTGIASAAHILARTATELG